MTDSATETSRDEESLLTILRDKALRTRVARFLAVPAAVQLGRCCKELSQLALGADGDGAMVVQSAAVGNVPPKLRGVLWVLKLKPWLLEDLFRYAFKAQVAAVAPRMQQLLEAQVRHHNTHTALHQKAIREHANTSEFSDDEDEEEEEEESEGAGAEDPGRERTVQTPFFRDGDDDEAAAGGSPRGRRIAVGFRTPDGAVGGGGGGGGGGGAPDAEDTDDEDDEDDGYFIELGSREGEAAKHLSVSESLSMAWHSGLFTSVRADRLGGCTGRIPAATDVQWMRGVGKALPSRRAGADAAATARLPRPHVDDESGFGMSVRAETLCQYSAERGDALRPLREAKWLRLPLLPHAAAADARPPPISVDGGSPGVARAASGLPEEGGGAGGGVAAEGELPRAPETPLAAQTPRAPARKRALSRIIDVSALLGLSGQKGGGADGGREGKDQASSTVAPSSTRALDWLSMRSPVLSTPRRASPSAAPSPSPPARGGSAGKLATPASGRGAARRPSFGRSFPSLGLLQSPLQWGSRHGAAKDSAAAAALGRRVACEMCCLWYFSASGETRRCPRCRAQALTLSPAAQVWVFRAHSYERLAGVTELPIAAPEGSNLWNAAIESVTQEGTAAAAGARSAARVHAAAGMGMLDPFVTSWEQIEADLPRTIPSDSPLTGPMRRVLRAYALYSPVVGYCQGMSYVAAFLFATAGTNERESFWMFTALMERYGLKSLYLPELKRLRCLCYQLDRVLREPDMRAGGEWLEKFHVDSLLFAASSIQTLFTDGRVMNPDAVAVIWDVLICDGVLCADGGDGGGSCAGESGAPPTLAQRTYGFILRVITAMMRRSAPLLEGASFEQGLQIVQTFQHLRLDTAKDGRELVREALALPISYGRLEQYEREFITGSQ